MIDADRLIEIAATLEDNAVDSKTHIKQCKPKHLVGLTANRAGFLRLAASCLRAAAEPIVEDDCRSKPVSISEPHDHFFVDDDSGSIIEFLQRMETWPEPLEYVEARKKRASKNDRWALFTCGIIGFVILFVIVAGVTAIVGWFR